MANIVDIIELASSGAGALSSATGAAERLKKLISGSGPPPTEAHAVLLDLFNQLIDAKRNQARLEDRLLALQRELQERDQFEIEAARYTLGETELGASVYFLKPDDSTGEPAHCICPKCLAKREKQILQPNPENRNLLICFGCGATFPNRSEGSGIRFGPVRRPGFDPLDY